MIKALRYTLLIMSIVVITGTVAGLTSHVNHCLLQGEVLNMIAGIILTPVGVLNGWTHLL